MSSKLAPPSQNSRTSLGLVVIRVIAGAALVLHGWDKIQAPMGWIEGIKNSGAVVPGILETLAPVAAVGEFGGGLLLVLGLLSPIGALLVIGTMAGAIYFHLQNGQPFVDPAGSWELAAMHLVVGGMVLYAGPGAFSVDKVLNKRKS